MRKRKERANRIVRMLGAMEVAPELRESAYGWLSVTAETMKKSKATASRDFAIARRIHFQFARMFGRTLELKKDQVKWSWDFSHYGFRARVSVQASADGDCGRMRHLQSAFLLTDGLIEGLRADSVRALSARLLFD